MREICIQYQVKDLRWSSLEKQLQFLTIFVKKLNLKCLTGLEYVSDSKYINLLNIHKFSLIWQGSEYVSGCNYRRILNIPGSQVCWVSVNASNASGSKYVWIWLSDALWQGSKYAWSTFRRVLNKPLLLNMLGLKIWLGYECARVTQGVEYAWINLNMP